MKTKFKLVQTKEARAEAKSANADLKKTTQAIQRHIANCKAETKLMRVTKARLLATAKSAKDKVKALQAENKAIRTVAKLPK